MCMECRLWFWSAAKAYHLIRIVRVLGGSAVSESMSCLRCLVGRAAVSLECPTL